MCHTATDPHHVTHLPNSSHITQLPTFITCHIAAISSCVKQLPADMCHTAANFHLPKYDIDVLVLQPTVQRER